jgi:hypothetical protein
LDAGFLLFLKTLALGFNVARETIDRTSAARSAAISAQRAQVSTSSFPVSAQVCTVLFIFAPA